MVDSNLGCLRSRPARLKLTTRDEGRALTSLEVRRPFERVKSLTRIALGVEDPVQGRLSKLIAEQGGDLACVLSTDRATVFEQGTLALRPDLLIIDMAWCDIGLSLIERLVKSQSAPIVVIDTERSTPYTRARIARAKELGVVAVLPLPTARDMRSAEARESLLAQLRTTVSRTRPTIPAQAAAGA
jgi:hypothetical protein